MNIHEGKGFVKKHSRQGVWLIADKEIFKKSSPLKSQVRIH